MRVLVIGTGVIGSIYGWALAGCGHDIAHLVRPGRAAALRDGFPVDMCDRRKGHKRRASAWYRPQVVDSVRPEDRFELVVVPVKHYALLPTLSEITPGAGEAEFLLLTQNWQGVAAIDAVLPRARYVFGDAKAGGAFVDGKLVAALKGIDIGPPEGAPSDLAGKVAALFASADVTTGVHAQMLHYLWIQYALSGGPWGALVQAGSLESLMRDRRAMLAAWDAAAECLQVVARRGVDVSRYPDARPFLANSRLRRELGMLLVRWMFRHDEYRRRCSAHALGDPREVRTFYEDLVTTGRDLGVAMPVMESFGRAVRDLAG